MSNAAQFTRDKPCGKVELWNCFRQGGKYPPRPLVAVRAEIGANAPKYLLREGYMRQYEFKGTDYYCLTPSGVSWLEKGIARHCELHPEDARMCKERPTGSGESPTPVVRRREVSALTTGTRRIIRR